MEGCGGPGSLRSENLVWKANAIEMEPFNAVAQRYLDADGHHGVREVQLWPAFTGLAGRIRKLDSCRLWGWP